MKKENWRTAASDFQFLEDELRYFHLYKRRIEHLRNNHIYAVPDRDEGGGRGNTVSRPTERMAVGIMQDARIAYLENYVSNVESVIKHLDSEKKRFLSRMYWEPNKTSNYFIICEELGISISTLRRWRKDLLEAIGGVTGLKREVGSL